MARLAPREGEARKTKIGTTILERTSGLMARFRSSDEGEFRTPGEVIDYVVGATLDVSDETARELARFCEQKGGEARKKLDSLGNWGAGKMQESEARRTADGYEKLANLFSRLSPCADGTVTREPMRRVDLEDGAYVVFPDADDWVVLNEDRAFESSHVLVVEIKNGYKYSAPHFVFFASRPNSEIDRDTVLGEVASVWPMLSKVRKAVVEPAYDRDGRMLNEKEFNEAPSIGIFEIRDSTSFNSIKDAPYGAVVYRG